MNAIAVIVYTRFRWPPNIGEALEIAQEITEDIDSQFLENDITLSLDKGLDKLKTDGLSDNGTGVSETSNVECCNARCG